MLPGLKKLDMKPIADANSLPVTVTVATDPRTTTDVTRPPQAPWPSRVSVSEVSRPMLGQRPSIDGCRGRVGPRERVVGVGLADEVGLSPGQHVATVGRAELGEGRGARVADRLARRRRDGGVGGGLLGLDRLHHLARRGVTGVVGPSRGHVHPLVVGIRPRRDRLGPHRLGGPRRRHLVGHDAAQVALHGKGVDDGDRGTGRGGRPHVAQLAPIGVVCRAGALAQGARAGVVEGRGQVAAAGALR